MLNIYLTFIICFFTNIYAGHLQEQVKELEVQYPKKDVALAVQGYAVRFLKYNSSCGLPLKAEAPATPDRISDLGIQDVSWEDHLTEVWLTLSIVLLVNLPMLEIYISVSHLPSCFSLASPSTHHLAQMQSQLYVINNFKFTSVTYCGYKHSFL